MKNIQGERLQEIERNVLEMKDPDFSIWLYEHKCKIGKGQSSKPYEAQTIAAWRKGRRDVPEKVQRVLADNVLIKGQSLRIEYLKGIDNYKTELERQEHFLGDVLKEQKEIAKRFSKGFREVDIFSEAKAALIQSVLNVFPSKNINSENIESFSAYMLAAIKAAIDTYLNVYNKKGGEE